MAGEFIKPTSIKPATEGTIANPDDYNQNIAGQSKGSILPIDIDGNFADGNIGNETIVTNGALVVDIKLRDTGNLKVYNAAGVLQKTTSVNNIGAGVLVSIQTFTSSGTYTRPGGVNFVLIKGIGSGGGGGGGSDDSDPVGPGGGGGGGGYVEKLITSVGTGLTVTIAAGGTAGAAASNGGNASDSSFDSIVIKGGLGGLGNSGSGGAGGAGGNPTAGDINVKGDNGESDLQGSRGGASALAYGFKSFDFSDVGKVFGGGGSGGDTSTNGDAGGAGATGIIIVYEYS